MKRAYRLTLLVLLSVCSTALTAYSQADAALTIYVHEGSLNGTMLSGVEITGDDEAGNEFTGITDGDGVAVVRGQPGTWQFTFYKEGYQPLDLSYDVAETDEAAAYLLKETSSQDSSRDEAALTIYIHEGNLNGTMLPGVQIMGEDAAGNEFAEVTGSEGSAVLYGQPGTWQFTFYKDGYEPLDLSYDVAETEAAAAYLLKTA